MQYHSIVFKSTFSWTVSRADDEDVSPKRLDVKNEILLYYVLYMYIDIVPTLCVRARARVCVCVCDLSRNHHSRIEKKWFTFFV